MRAVSRLDQVAVLAHLTEDRLAEGAVALVQVLEGLGDVRLHLLQLRADRVHAVQGGGVRDRTDRRGRGLHGVARHAAGLGQFLHVVLETRRAHGERLEALVAGRQEALDGLVAGEQRDDALLLGPCVGPRGAPHLGGDLPHQDGRLLLERVEPLLQVLVDRPFDGVGHLALLLGQPRIRGGWGDRGVGNGDGGRPAEQTTPGGAGRGSVLGRVFGTGLNHDVFSRSGAGAVVRRSIGHDLGRYTQADVETWWRASLPGDGGQPILNVPTGGA